MFSTLKQALGVTGLLSLIALFGIFMAKTWDHPGFVPDTRDVAMLVFLAASAFCTSAVKVQLIKDRPFDGLMYTPAMIALVSFVLFLTFFPRIDIWTATPLLDAAWTISVTTNLLLDLLVMIMVLFGVRDSGRV
ncbi:MAG: hypothetical protein A2826_00635 [Candidatus Doudnabacteria bacterium RIFCSPHIGHO2_01_FULL_43_23]|uniref:Uncharacterized protein n=1 Tax=Candidatus Doudnabacteria bacterium RIFCSPHIGHO2_01_FULL_43_23 TaxID=1817822 RepID=A0A1F5NRB1_9BACT|nr:MAG: hypothetical protein A2826_00635 [Candidatus Doudnabacteria bacterium RIFCSPHIGHO2_01_FULL_43_23]